MMNIPGYTFPVEEFLMEDVVEMIGCVSPRPSLVVAVMSTGARNIICEHRSVQRYAHDVTIYIQSEGDNALRSPARSSLQYKDDVTGIVAVNLYVCTSVRKHL